MSSAETITVPHLGSSTIGYRFGQPYDAALPTLVMVNSFSTSVELYRPQFADEKLAATANLLALEPYGHGRTRATYGQFTYWDSAVANLQVLDALGIPEAFVLGTSMDYESQRSRDLGCWDGIAFCTPAIDALAGTVGEDWVMPTELVDAVLQEGFGEEVPPEERAFWHEESQRNYSGDAGRERLRIISINLRDRDGLHGRLDSVRCPVLWMQGTADTVYSVANAEEEIDLFVNSRDAQLRVVEGGRHFLSATHPDEVDTATIEFIDRWT